MYTFSYFYMYSFENNINIIIETSYETRAILHMNNLVVLLHTYIHIYYILMLL